MNPIGGKVSNHGRWKSCSASLAILGLVLVMGTLLGRRLLSVESDRLGISHIPSDSNVEIGSRPTLAPLSETVAGDQRLDAAGVSENDSSTASPGATLVVRFRLPLTSSDETALVGESVYLSDESALGSASTLERQGQVGEGLTCGFENLPTDVELEVYCRPAAFTAVQRRGLRLAAGETRVVEIDLAQGVSLAGRVVDAAGSGLAGVEVRSHSSGEPDWAPGPHGLTGGDGAFEFHGIFPGKVCLRATRPGYREDVLQLGTLTNGTRRIGIRLQLKSGARVAGRVQWPDGRPAAGAWVEIASQDPDWTAPLLADAGDDGSFSFTGLMGRAFTIFASARPSSTNTAVGAPLRAMLEGVTPGRTDLLLILQEGRVLEGWVVDDRGAPVPSFDIRAVPQRGPGEPYPRLSVAQTFHDPGGEFHLEGLWPTIQDLSFEASEHVRRRLTGVDPPTPAPLRVVLTRAARLSGCVRRTDGTPVPGARVETHTSVSRASDDPGGNSSTTSRSDGAFTLGDVAPGAVTLTAHAYGIGESAPRDLALNAGEERTGLDITLVGHGSLRVRVLPAAGFVSGRSITARGHVNGRWGTARERTDASGLAVLSDLVPGPYTVTLEHADLLPNGETVPDGDPAAFSIVTAAHVREGCATEVDFGARPEPYRIHGEVTRGGELVPALTVTATLQDDGEVMAVTDAGGTFSLDLPHPGFVTFTLGEGGDAVTDQRDLTIDAHDVLRFELPAGSLAGVVVDDQGEAVAGCPVEVAAVQLASGDPAHWSPRNCETDEDGRFSFTNLPVGRLRLCAGPLDFPGRKAPGCSAAEMVELNRNTSRDDFRLVLGSCGAIVGVLRSPQGEPRANTLVDVVATDVPGSAIAGSAWTDDEGRFGVFRLSPGRYGVNANVGGFHESNKSDEIVEVQAGETTEVTIVR